MDLNEYIRMSYERPNRKVLEGLGASEDLIEYLMETPGNTNWNVVGSIGESDEGDWTTIRLEYSNDQSLFPERPHLVSRNPQDIQNFYLLYNMCMNNEHPIVITNGITLGREVRNNPMAYATNSCYEEDGHFIKCINAALIRDAKDDNNESFLYNQLNNSQVALENDYIEIKFKVGNYYTLSIPDLFQETTFSVERNSSWNIDTFFADLGAPGYGFTDGINTYLDGDTIVFNKDMTLNLVEPE